MQINYKYMRVAYSLEEFGPKIYELYISGQKTKKYTDIDLFYDDMAKDGWEIKGFCINKYEVFHVIFSKLLS
jgi:hypothetical protein